ncbi:MAG TPA: amidase, partial [Thermomicrobiales bacterium]|nr:amidase [Thermomicrobiales bacterium]
MTLDLTSLTLHDAMKKLDARELSAAELMRESLMRLDATDESIQSWVEIEPRYAMEMAVAADRRRAIGPAPQPFLGIPLGIKDMIDVAGMRTRCNMESRVNVDPAHHDADAAAALRRDGAVLLGKTVTQEAAAGVVSDPARSPWDPERIPGGSSGGSAAAVAAGTCLGALGTDTGGSIRTPAALVGVVGMKPTYGRLSVAGIFPLSPSMDTVGPIARTVHDTAILYLSLAGQRKGIPALENRFPAGGGRLDGKRIGVPRAYFLDRVQPDVASAFRDAIAVLETLGAEIVECDWREAEASRGVALMISRVESAAIHRDQLRSAPELMGEALRSRLEAGSLVTGDDY